MVPIREKVLSDFWRQSSEVRQLILYQSVFLVLGKLYDSRLRAGSRSDMAVLHAFRIVHSISILTPDQAQQQKSRLINLISIARSTSRSRVLHQICDIVEMTLRDEQEKAVLRALSNDDEVLIDSFARLPSVRGPAGRIGEFEHDEGSDAAGSNPALVGAISTLLLVESTWRFWRDWVSGLARTSAIDWKFQQRVALIPDEEWERGPEHIAQKIEEIKAEYLAEQLPLAEDLEFDQDSGTFHTVPREMAKPDLLGATLNQVEDALDDVMENCSNGINERSVECRKLTRTFRKYGNDPQRIEMDFTTVYAGLTRQIISGELPASEENLALQSALEEGAKAVRATHPEVAENRRILQEQALRELTPDEKATLEDALPLLQAISDEALAEEWAQDIPVLTNDSLLPVPNTAPRLPGADEATRIFGRAARMAVLMKKSSDIIHKIDGSAGYKATRILTTVSALVGIGIAIASVF